MNRLALALIAALITAASTAGPAPAAARCGVERWPVKVMTDTAPVSLTVHRTTIAHLDALPVPAGAGTHAPRLEPQEGTTYRITAQLVSDKLEADSDYHLVLRNAAGQTMIAEIPSPACAQGSRALARISAARSYYDATIGPAQRHFRSIGRTVTITGVAFFDAIHGQTGVAPNGIELHPVTAIHAP